jgi:plasmid stabilization system protein ParE
LAATYRSTKRYAAEIPLLAQDLVECERKLGPGHDDTVPVRRILSHLYARSESFDEAADQLEHLLAHHERTFGPRRDETLVVRNNLAHAYHRLGRLPEATELYERVLSWAATIAASNATRTSCRRVSGCWGRTIRAR